MNCFKSELDLFSRKAIQSSIIATEQHVFSPINSLENANMIEFISLGREQHLRDLSSMYLKLDLQILDKDGKAFGASDTGSRAFVNNILYSLFRSCSISLGGRLVNESDQAFGLKNYIVTLLSYGEHSANTQLATQGWIKDTAGSMEATSTNLGFKKREALTEKSKIIEVYGRLTQDITNISKLLIGGIELKITLALERPDYFILSSDEADSATVKITNASLYLDYIEISSSLLMHYEAMLEKVDIPLEYIRSDIRVITLPAGQTSLTQDNLFLGERLPNLIILFFIANNRHNGIRNLNPYKLEHNQLTNICIYVSGKRQPLHPITLNMENNNYARAFQTIAETIKIDKSDRSHQINYDEYSKGYFMLGFNLRPDRSGDLSCRSPPVAGSIRVEGQFGKALTESTNLCIYSEFDACVSVTRDRNIILNY